MLCGLGAKGGLGEEAGDGWKCIRRECQQISSEGDGISVQCREKVAAFHVVQSRLDEVWPFLDEPPAERAAQEGGGDETHGKSGPNRANNLTPGSAGTHVQCARGLCKELSEVLPVFAFGGGEARP